MPKLIFYIVLFFLFCSSCISRENTGKVEYMDFVDPTIGNVAPLLAPNRPIVHLPNEMIRFFPNRYDHLDLRILDFPLTTLNTITPQFCFSIKPNTDAYNYNSDDYGLRYDHDFEIIKPHYYYNKFIDSKIEMEFVPGSNSGIFRFNFPEDITKQLILGHYFENGKYEIIDNNKITGIEYVNVPNHDQVGEVFMYGEFSDSFEYDLSDSALIWDLISVNDWGRSEPKLGKGNSLSVHFAKSESSTIEFRYSLSFISIDQARENFKEINEIDFDNIKEEAYLTWESCLSQIEIEGGDISDMRTFYSALYRSYVRMINISEGNKYFSGFDSEVHESERPFYVDDYTWGNYLALHPLRVLLEPEKEADMLQSYVDMYRHSGWMPEYPKHFGDRQGMFGFHSAIMFLDAYRKGINNFDVEDALAGIIKNSTEATMLPFRNGPKSNLEEFYYENGFYPALRPGQIESDSFALAKEGQVRSSVAVTLADSYDSWAVGQLALELGLSTPLSESIYERKSNYKNLWNSETKMFLPKDDMGNWIYIDPKFDGGINGYDYYNQNNGWMYLWNVQHDIPGLIELFGGVEKFEEKLDQLFVSSLERSKADFYAKFPNSTAMIGQFSFGNQVAFFIPYLYNFTNSPWKTQQLTRFILRTWFQDNIFGCPGDDDAGSMSAFVVFSSIGLFPVAPGTPEYAITSPLFNKSTIKLNNGNKFTIVSNSRSDREKYIKNAYLNGEKLENLFISHDDIISGGELRLEMDESPF